LVSAHSPSWLGNRHRKLIRCRLENCHWNCFPSWHLVSSAHTVPVVSVIITENYVADDSDIINETSFIADACIGQRTQSQLTRKSTPKTDSLPTRKSSPKPLPQLRLGFIFAHSPSWLGNGHRKQSSGCLRNNQLDCLHRWGLASSVHTVPVDSLIVIENGVPDDSEIINETASRADA
jgi:hypothetical protein